MGTFRVPRLLNIEECCGSMYLTGGGGAGGCLLVACGAGRGSEGATLWRRGSAGFGGGGGVKQGDG